MSEFSFEPDLLKAVIDHVGAAIAVMDQEGRIVFANGVFRTLFGERPDLNATRWEDWYTHARVQDRFGRDIPLAETAVMRVLGGEQDVDFKNMRVAFPDGRVKWLHSSVHRFSVMGLSGVLAVATDESTQTELQHTSEQLDRLETLGTLAKTLAHDFNNVLQAIRSSAYLALSDASLPEALRARLQHISDATGNATVLVRRLMQFGQTQRLQLQPLQLNDVVRDVLHLLGPRLSSGVSVEADLYPRLPMVEADRAQMEQVLVNLIVNAADAMPEGGRLHIATKIAESSPDDDTAKQQSVLMSVSDTGIGISEDNLPHIFEPFYTTKPVGQSSGLGLSSVYGIVRQHGGDIKVNSKLGEGTAFTISFPVRKTSSATQRATPSLHD
jgi:PAS domain S-box-containing protein